MSKTTRSLEIAIDLLDRVQGTALYNIHKQTYKYTDKEYEQAVEALGELYLFLISRKKDGKQRED